MKIARLAQLLLLFVLPTQAFCDEAGMLASGCDECHGLQGVSKVSDIPTIAGQPADYISATLRAYQQWERPCVKTSFRSGDLSRPKTNMCKLSEVLTYQDIDALGDHYETQEFIPANQPYDPAKAALGGDLHEINCETCHAMGGSVPARGPILAGQWAPYLRTAITQALNGEHLVPPIMEKRLVEISKEDIEFLVNFYASQQ